MTNGAQVVLDCLEKFNCSYIFGCPGTTEVPLLDALVGRESPQYILVPQEGVAVAAAEGWARVTGKLGVANLHASVGLANGVSQVAAAQNGKAPLLIMNCVKPRQLLGRGGFTVAHDHQEMVKQFTKWDWMSLRPEQLGEDLLRAMRQALTPPTGPVYLGIPQDLMEAEVEKPKVKFPVGSSSRPAREDVAMAAELLTRSKFPLVVAGSGIAIERAMPEMLALAEKLGSGVLAENRLHVDYNAFPTEHPQFLGPFKPGSPVLEEADLLLVVGTRLFVEFQPATSSWIPPELPVIHLYLEASEIGRLYPVEVALAGSLKEGLIDLRTALLDIPENEGGVLDRKARVKQLRQAYEDALAAELEKVREQVPLRVPFLVETINEVIEESTTVVTDAATSNDPLVEYLKRFDELSFYASSTGGSLGWGMGAALGVKLGAPERKVLAVIGDGTFMFGVPALWTAVKYQIPVIFIIINNSTYAAVKAGLLRYGKEAARKGVFPATDIAGPNYSEVARGFGMAAQRVCTPGELREALRLALQIEKPFLLEVITDPDDVGNIAR